ncbi:DedA family protein [Candidatus Wolfebacteria bacterium]|nr:DedA family protein [Candidatus Wolfebacteria bacterium]
MIFTILETVSNFILLIVRDTGYLGVFLLMFLESMNLPISSEIIMPFSGFLAVSGIFNFWLVVFLGALGNLFGSLFSYWLGFLSRKGFLKNADSKNIERAKKWLFFFGDWTAFISRVLPIVRTFISFPLGVLGVKSIWKFSVLTFSGSFIWSFFLAWLGFILGENWQSLEVYFRKFDYLILAAILAIIIWWIWSHFRNNKNEQKTCNF